MFSVDNSDVYVDSVGLRCLFICISVEILSTLSDEISTDDGAYFRLIDNGLFERLTGAVASDEFMLNLVCFIIVLKVKKSRKQCIYL